MKKELRDICFGRPTVKNLQRLLGKLQHDSLVVIQLRGIVRMLQAALPADLVSSGDSKKRNELLYLTPSYK